MRDAVGHHRLARWAPGAVRLRTYSRGWLRGDVVAGLTVAAYLVPQVMAYAGVAGLPPVAGLWAALLPLLVYALLGTSRLLSVGPESTTALMTAAAVAPLAVGDPARYAALAAAAGIAVGLLLLLAGIARMGFVADLLSRPVLVGYMAGVALLMIEGQLERLTGMSIDSEGFFSSFAYLATHLGDADPLTVALAAAVLVFLLVVARLWPRVPGPLLGVLLATAVVVAFGLQDQVAVVGEVPQGLPLPQLPAVGWSDATALLLPAVGIAVVAYTDTVLTGRGFARRGDAPVDADAELRALGASNLGAGVMQGFPISSSGSRTALALASGGRGQGYSLVVLAALVCVLLFAGPLLAAFPDAALGALVVFAALRLVDIPEFRALWAFRRTEFALALAATVGVLVTDILYGILVAVGLSVLDLLARVARPPYAVLGFASGVPGMHDVADYPGAQEEPGLVVFRYDSPLFFANADDFHRRALHALDARPGTRWFLINAEANVEIDSTAAAAIDSLRRDVIDRDVEFGMARVKMDLRRQLDRAGLIDLIGDDRIFPTLPTAVDAYRDWVADHAD
jgi:sulfate permease, SulP family